ncbi:hypothetical protein I551_3958 [Mycobacterium ulcerans str. Harvey]|uniref:SnoaL-like domain protein n=1 Tax=Mycobacterium ulcerans str. Harvey TaxID=1299332 RepID=A0ABN0QXY8_MYCUL|nr:hypothetical protein I551_3958 [Mycobacterium ulcerans str. Harvey]
MSIALLREMFEKMVVAKNAELIGHYYDPDFVMYSDGLRQEFAEFNEGHRKIYASAISYAIEYDEDAWVQAPTGSPDACGSPHRGPGKSRRESKSYSSPHTETAASTESGRQHGRVGAMWPRSKTTDRPRPVAPRRPDARASDHRSGGGG